MVCVVFFSGEACLMRGRVVRAAGKFCLHPAGSLLGVLVMVSSQLA